MNIMDHPRRDDHVDGDDRGEGQHLAAAFAALRLAVRDVPHDNAGDRDEHETMPISEDTSAPMASPESGCSAEPSVADCIRMAAGSAGRMAAARLLRLFPRVGWSGHAAGPSIGSDNGIPAW
jgi:hypothetical protein